MNFWEKIQKDLKKNLKEGFDIFREGGTVISKKIEELTEEGKKKYKIFNLNMQVQEDFAKLGGQIYDLTAKKSKDPLKNRNVVSMLKKINKLEAQISKLESLKVVRPERSGAGKIRKRVSGKSKRPTQRKSGKAQ